MTDPIIDRCDQCGDWRADAWCWACYWSAQRHLERIAGNRTRIVRMRGAA